ncbi:MAG: N-6 DNA methylase [Planctomycetaceae bacterium]|nr:N-6 DNA methylase [Planctomycetaceae bacterium]
MSLNERKTEQIVRKHFEKFADNIILEEQKSDNPKIQKLLATASKNGAGIGLPDFIVQYKNNPQFIIVIECKSDTNKHESSTRDQYKNYAVDGAILYASYLAKDYDVLAIAVGGQTIHELKVSHFLQLKSEIQSVSLFGEKLLPPDDYYNGYIKSPEKFRQDYHKLLDFSQELNEKLHSEKIVESDRGLLLSCILIALENKAFLKSYSTYEKPKQLADYLITTVQNEFQNANIDADKLEILKNRFAFIRTDTSLSKKDKILRTFIDDINKNIKDFIQTHKYIDILGQLYIEFLRYANSDKGLGIVLTPPHITDFMVKLVEVNKDSIVYDNCTGTGGFLVSAMKQMIVDAKGDTAKIKQIKQEQIIGVEYQAHIFALACSNMFIHQDGKTNIFNGSCFDQKIIEQIKAIHPTVGLLNPPYKGNKKTDTDEYEFILNNLECLEQGGRCAAIIPMQEALATSGKIYDYKNKILKSHTLEAVFSMPNELFFNSKVNVVSCIMVFTAKRPHPKNKKVFLGYYKDDGFIKQKNKGRIDFFHKFESEINELWFTHFLNRQEKPGLSVNKILNANDEWCAEAYMETDYSAINNANFEDTILNYVIFLLAGKKIKDVVYKPVNSRHRQQLDVTKWKEFYLKELFDITGSKTTPKAELEEFGNGDYPYVTTQATNNGVEKFYNYKTEKGNVITIDSAVMGYCAYQEFDFSASDHVEKLIPKFTMDRLIGLFLATILNQEQYRYNYGRKASQTRLETGKIKLPVKSDNKPDWEFIKNYINTLPYSANL